MSTPPVRVTIETTDPDTSEFWRIDCTTPDALWAWLTGIWQPSFNRLSHNATIRVFRATDQ